MYSSTVLHLLEALRRRNYFSLQRCIPRCEFSKSMQHIRILNRSSFIQVSFISRYRSSLLPIHLIMYALPLGMEIFPGLQSIFFRRRALISSIFSRRFLVTRSIFFQTQMMTDSKGIKETGKDVFGNHRFQLSPETSQRPNRSYSYRDTISRVHFVILD